MKLFCQNKEAHLTYSMNVHPGESADEVIQNIQDYVIPIKKEIAKDKAFGIGLRLSYQAASEFLLQEKLQKLQCLCKKNDLYVFTINGFIYDSFHKDSVKETVYLPDWRDKRRLQYTSILARVLCDLLPQNMVGSISTVPIGWKQHFTSEEDRKQAACLLLEQAAYLYRLSQETGKIIALALEPEPGCVLETACQTARFFQDFLFSEKGISYLQEFSGLSVSACREIVARHLGVCYDTCHIAIFYEKPSQVFFLLQETGVSIFKIQISSALKIQFLAKDSKILKSLDAFAESRYLHQVVQKEGDFLTFFSDLPLAFQSLKERKDNPFLEWRIHFHVPIFLEKLGELATTKDHILDVLQLWKQNLVCNHLEVETYTWEVLPKAFQEKSMVDAIAKELKWARENTI